MTPDELTRLAIALRETGAVKVRLGELEVLWAPPLPSRTTVDAPARTNGSGKTPVRTESAEEARLRAFRAELEGEDEP